MYTAPAAEILTIGDELCRGEIVDTNSAWLAERLTELGLHVRWRSSVTDDEADMAAALAQAAARARVVVCSGGLGPLVDGAPATARRVWRVAGMGESHVDHALAGLLDGVAGATLHFRIAYPENLVTVVARRASRDEAEAAIAALDGEVRRRLGGA